MSESNDGGPAFAHGGNSLEVAEEGMSLRDYFAGAALLVMAFQQRIDEPQVIAARAYALASAMLAERAKAEAAREH